MNTQKFKFHSDPGHGWLAVKRTMIEELGIAKEISFCSYSNGKTVYLEEDCDCLKFIRAYEQKFGQKPVIECLKSRNSSSPIRSMKRYCA